MVPIPRTARARPLQTCQAAPVESANVRMATWLRQRAPSCGAETPRLLRLFARGRACAIDCRRAHACHTRLDPQPGTHANAKFVVGLAAVDSPGMDLKQKNSLHRVRMRRECRLRHSRLAQGAYRWWCERSNDFGPMPRGQPELLVPDLPRDDPLRGRHQEARLRPPTPVSRFTHVCAASYRGHGGREHRAPASRCRGLRRLQLRTWALMGAAVG
jgi:hypothetical protein